MLNRYRSKVNDELTTFLQGKDGEVARLVRDLTLRGGKRLRPLLAIAAYTCYKEDDEIVSASLATELLHSALLIHDDVLDKSAERRGGPAVHTEYDGHTGVCAGVLAGDKALAWMHELVVTSAFDEKVKVDVMSLLSDVMATECDGEWHDITGLEEVTEESVVDLYVEKTATYTTLAPLRLGAICAGVGRDVFDTFGRELGVAYQIKDDVKGVFGVEDKPSTDIVDGQRSLLLAKTLAECSASEERFIRERYGTDTGVERIRDLFRTYALQYCRDEVDARLQRAVSHLPRVERDEGMDMLGSVVDVVREW